jgi:hypothetical protein
MLAVAFPVTEDIPTSVKSRNLFKENSAPILLPRIKRFTAAQSSSIGLRRLVRGSLRAPWPSAFKIWSILFFLSLRLNQVIKLAFTHTGIISNPLSPKPWNHACLYCVGYLDGGLSTCIQWYGALSKTTTDFSGGFGINFFASIFQNLYHSFGRGSSRSLILLCTVHKLRNRDEAILWTGVSDN